MKKAALPAATPTNLASLDGLRAVSVLIVFLAHVGLGHVVPGGFGVTVFFFLSGFLITSLLVREHATYGHVSIAAFYQRRVLRILPPVLLTIGLAMFAVWLGYAQGALDPWTIFSQVFFFFNYYTQIYAGNSSVDGLSVLWSLSSEEQFYMIFPLVFVALVRSRFHIPAIVALIGTVLVWRVIRFEVFAASQHSIYISTDTRIDSILFGCLLALIMAHYPDWLRIMSRQRLVVIGLALGVLGASFVLRDPMFRATLRYTVQGLALIPIFYLAVQHADTKMFGWLNWPLLRWFGRRSFSFYLCHYVIIKMLIFNGIDANNLIVLVPMAFALSVCFSVFVYHVAEKPFYPLRKRLTGHGAKRRSGGAPWRGLGAAFVDVRKADPRF